jgi:hypothetical protein
MLRFLCISLSLTGVLLSTTNFGLALDGHDARLLHVLIIADTTDEQVGELVNIDGQNLYALLVDEVPQARRGQIKVLSGDSVTSEAIQGHIQGLQVDPNDALFVYFTGHGAYVANRGQVLRMKGGELLQRSELLSQMQGKGARLTVLITDACSNIIEDKLRPKYAYSMAEGIDHDGCRYLFFRHKGVVDIHAASPGQESVALSEKGSLFTKALVDALGMANAAYERVPITWRDVMGIVSERTQESFREQRENNPDFRVLFPNQTTQTPKVASLGEPINVPIPKVPWRLGIQVEEAGGRGVRVTEVFPNSQAEWAGFQVGDVLTRIETGRVQPYVTEIRNSRDFMTTFWSSESALQPEVHKFVLLDESTGKSHSVRVRIRDVQVRQQ